MEELLDVVEVKAKIDYTLDLIFENGAKRSFDMSGLLCKKPFLRIKSLPLFLMAKVDYGTVVWPGGIDVAPETLWDQSTSMEKGN